MNNLLFDIQKSLKSIEERLSAIENKISGEYLGEPDKEESTNDGGSNIVYSGFFLPVLNYGMYFVKIADDYKTPHEDVFETIKVYAKRFILAYYFNSDISSQWLYGKKVEAVLENGVEVFIQFMQGYSCHVVPIHWEMLNGEFGNNDMIAFCYTSLSDEFNKEKVRRMIVDKLLKERKRIDYLNDNIYVDIVAC